MIDLRNLGDNFQGIIFGIDIYNVENILNLKLNILRNEKTILKIISFIYIYGFIEYRNDNILEIQKKYS